MPLIELQISTLVAPLLSALLTGVGTYVAMIDRLSVLETKMDTLTAQVEKHNGVMERTFKLERDSDTYWKRYDELKGRVVRLENNEMKG